MPLCRAFYQKEYYLSELCKDMTNSVIILQYSSEISDNHLWKNLFIPAAAGQSFFAFYPLNMIPFVQFPHLLAFVVLKDKTALKRLKSGS